MTFPERISGSSYFTSKTYGKMPGVGVGGVVLMLINGKSGGINLSF